MNGFYLYRFARTSNFWVLPWDKDWSFFEAARHPFYQTGANIIARRLLAIPQYNLFYRNELRRIADLAGGPGGWLESQMQSRIAHLRPSYRTDSKKPYPNGFQDEQMQLLTNFIRQRHPKLTVQL